MKELILKFLGRLILFLGSFFVTLLLAFAIIDLIKKITL